MRDTETGISRKMDHGCSYLTGDKEPLLQLTGPRNSGIPNVGLLGELLGDGRASGDSATVFLILGRLLYVDLGASAMMSDCFHQVCLSCYHRSQEVVFGHHPNLTVITVKVRRVGLVHQSSPSSYHHISSHLLIPASELLAARYP